MRRSSIPALVAALASALTLAACGSSANSGGGASASSTQPTPTTATGPTGTTPKSTTVATCGAPPAANIDHVGNFALRGPDGSPAVSSSVIELSPSEVAQVRAGHFTAAVLWQGSGQFITSLDQGIAARLKELGIKTIAKGDSDVDPTKQVNDVASALAASPDAMISLAVNPSIAASAFRPAVQRGVRLVFLSNVPNGYVAGRDYVGTVSANVVGMAATSATLLANSLHCRGKVGLLKFNAANFILNQWDKAYEAKLAEYPGIKVIADQGFTDPTKVQAVASAMLVQHPDLDAVYVTFATAAPGVYAAVRAANRPNLKVSTVQVNDEVGRAIKEGLTPGSAEAGVYDAGRTLADEAAYGLLGKQAPPFVVNTTVVPVTKDTLLSGWQKIYHAPPPSDLR
jgi:ribose transport system substrate-binding protein